MKKQELEKMAMDQLIELAMKQEAEITKIRGYESGMTPQRLAFLGKEALIRCFLKNEKTFKLNTI